MKKLNVFCLSAAMLLFPHAPCQAQVRTYTITTIAGNGTAGFSGDGERADAAQVNYPMGITIDRSGNLYIADQLNGRVRRVTADGIISTVAGKSTSGFSGDGGSATNAEFFNPCGIAFDGSGNLFIADTRSNRIRKVTTGGTISTVAGDGTAGFTGDGGVATSATLNVPITLATDAAGNLYIADAFNSAVRKLALDGTITTVAGNGIAGDQGDGGPATSANLNHPGGIALDAGGSLYIADTFNHRIRKVEPDGTMRLVAGNGTPGYSGDGGAAVAASLEYPQGIAVDAAGNVYVADSLNSRIRVVTANGTIATVAGNGGFGSTGDGGPAKRAQLNFPHGLALDAGGNIYFADTQSSRIRLLTPVAEPVNSTPLSSISSVISATAFGASSSISAGSWIEVYGSSLAANTRQWSSTDFNGAKAPTSLDGTSVTIGSTAAFIAYISPNQLNALVPSSVGPGPQQISVTTRAGTSAPYTITVNTIQPGLLATQSLKLGDKQYVGAVFPDGATYVLPPGGVAGAEPRPARPGEMITLYGVGFGAVTPGIEAGEVVHQSNALDQPRQTFFGPAQVSLAVPVQTQYRLTASASDGGTVTPAEAWQDAGTTATIVPEAADGYVFAGWEGDCTGADACQVTMDEPRSVKANFTPAPQ